MRAMVWSMREGSRPSADQSAYWHRMTLKARKDRDRWRGYAKKLERRLRGGDARTHGGRQRSSQNNLRVSGGAKGVICSVFGAHCSEALRVAWCESRWNPRATNGDYWGMFQFGSFARAHYGFAWDALTQARAAYRYWGDAGWSPWTCRPG